MFQNNMTTILQNRLLINQSGGMIHGLKAIPLTDSDMNELRVWYKMYTANNCANELAMKLKHLVSTMQQIKSYILRVMGGRHHLNNAFQMENERYRLQKLKNTASWLSEQLTNYSENRTTKIEMANGPIHSILSNVERTIDGIVNLIEINSITPLLSATNTRVKDMMSWYRQLLNAVTALIAFYGDSSIEDITRALKIWRHPVAVFETTDILQFKHSASESWRSWSSGIDQQEFVLSGKAITMISTALNDYRQALQSEITQIRMGCKSVREDLIGAIEDVIDDLRNVLKESSLRSNFVL